MPPGGTPAPGAPAATGAKPVSRGDRPKPTANPDELKVRPNEKGEVSFNFQGQPWLEVLEWLAQISHLSLDWQELPGDHLNLATQRPFKVDEVRDLINRHLLDRGYTLLRNGEVLTVVNTKKIDPAIVPRVRPQDLKTRDPHEFVKVSFVLEWLLAEQAVEELKPMLSSNGKLTALKTTNRLEAMDAVINLREIYEVLLEEQSHDGQEQLVREFQLEHVRAGDIEKMLRELLGMPKADSAGVGGPAPGSPEQMMQMQQQMQQAMQQAQQQGGQPPGAAAGGEKKIHLVVNSRRNSVLVQAPADKMAIIAQAVKTLDVPTHNSDTLQQALNNTKIYRLAAIDPEPFVKVLNEMGNLDPLTQIKVDRDNQAIIVSGTLADHFVIMQLLKKLDGSDRKFEVIRLRRLQADYVAGSIEFMMGAGEKKKDEMNPFMGYMPFGLDMGGGNKKKDANKFRVSADTENNRLLLWANEIELSEINNLLAKLGELPSRDGNPETLRVFELGSPEEAQKLLDKLRNVQPDLLPADAASTQKRPPATKSSLRQPEARKAPARTVAPAKPPETRAEVPRKPGQGGRILRAGKPASQFKLAGLEAPAADETAAQEPPSPLTPPQSSRRSLPPTKTRIQRAIEEHRAILPTFAPEPGETNEESQSVESEETRIQEPPADEAASELRGYRDYRTETRSPAGPVNVTVTEEGQLIISSPNTRSLDVLEDMIGQMAPPRRDFKIFHLKNRNTWAYGVVLNLEKFFGTEKDKGTGLKYSPWFGMYPSDNKDTGPRNLAKRRIPKFISDSDSRTILVTGADPEQLRIIQDLIDIYDRPDEGESKALRLTKIFQLKYSKARVIADAIKEVYRDLLSANDPALQQNQQNKDQKPQAAERSYTYIYGNSDDDKEKEPEAPIKFKGLLSLGVDEISNTVVVSSQEGLLENIGEMIDALDNAARPTQSTVQVIKVNRGLNGSDLQSRLAKILTRPQPQQPQQQGQPNPNQPQPGQPMNPAQQQQVEASQVSE